jgi:hypothetical protein
VVSALQPLRGRGRANTLTAPRSLFGFAKKRALIFANPTIGLLKARPGDAVLLPLTDEQIHAREALATDPACRVIIALAADHAARNGAIRQRFRPRLTWLCRRHRALHYADGRPYSRS